MHPELLNNSLFLRYYNQWQQDPTSIVFAPIAEYFLSYGLTDDAIRVCLAGLHHHPDLVSGRLSLAKAYLRKKEFTKAKGELQRVLNLVPNQSKALELFGQISGEAPKGARHLFEEQREEGRGFNQVGSLTEELSCSKRSQAPLETTRWQTITMAKIYTAQGHRDQARQVYQAILAKDPQNQEAIQGLKQLEGEG